MQPKKKQTDLVAKVNAAYGVGDKILVKQDDGSVKQWTMQAPASILGGHTAVIWAEEHSGCYIAERVIFPKKERYAVKIEFEDNGQDFTFFNASFYPDFQFGTVVKAGPFQNSIWAGMSILSGLPVVGGHLSVSKSPTDEVIAIKHKITAITYDK